MAAEVVLALFVGVPATAYAVAVAWVRAAMRRIAETEIGFLRDPVTTSRFLIFSMLFFMSTLLGLAILLQTPSLPQDPLVDDVLTRLGVTWAVASVATLISQAWIVIRRGSPSFRDDFGKVLILAVYPTITIVFALVIALLVVAQLRNGAISSSAADTLNRASLYMLVGSAAAPLGAAVANRVKSLEGRGFGTALVRAVTTEPLLILALLLALLEIAKV